MISRRTKRRAQKDTGRLLYKIFYLSSLFVSFERVVPSLRVRESWRPNITEIFWPLSYGRQRCVFLVLHGCSTGALAFLTTSRLPPQLYSPVSTGSLNSIDRNSTRRPYITFKLPRADMDMPPRLLPISGDRDVSLPLSLEWPVWSFSSGNNCHPVQRPLSSGASVYESIMGSFLPRPISSANFHPRVFLSELPPECVTSFRCITLNGIFGRVNRSKHNSNTNSNCCSWYNHLRIGTRTRGLVNNGTIGDHPNYCLVEISQSTEKSLEDLSRLAVSQTPVKYHQLMQVWKVLKE